MQQNKNQSVRLGNQRNNINIKTDIMNTVRKYNSYHNIEYELVLNDIDLAQTGARNRRRCIVLRSGGPVGPLCV